MEDQRSCIAGCPVVSAKSPADASGIVNGARLADQRLWVALSDPLRDGFDCCIRYGSGGWPGIEADCLAQETVFPVSAPALIAKEANANAAMDLTRLPLIHDLMPVGWAEWFAAAGGATPKSNGPVFSDSSLALRAAIDGLGVVLGRSVLASPDLVAGRLVRISKRVIASPFSYWLVRVPGQRDGLVELFSRWLLDHVLSQ